MKTIALNPEWNTCERLPSQIDSPKKPYSTITLCNIFVKNKGRMAVTYLLFNLENLLKLAQPLLIGLAINGLLNGSSVGLLLFVAQHLLHLGISTVRRMYDTRAFTAIYNDLATRLVVEQRKEGVEVSKVSARSSLSRGYIDFFEQQIPLVIRSGYAVLGGLVMLGWYDWSLIPICLVLLCPAVILNARYGKRTLKLSKLLHDQLEEEVEIVKRSDAVEVQSYFKNVGHSRIRLSDAEAINFGMMEFFILAVLAGAMVRFCSLGTPQAGDVFAVFRYIMMFILGMDAIPKIVQQLSKLKDIGSRLSSLGETPQISPTDD